MKILYSITFLFFSILAHSQEHNKKAYLLLDKKEELIIYDNYDYFICLTQCRKTM